MFARVLPPIVAALVLLAAPSAQAGVPDAVVEGLRDDPIYVHPDVDSALSESEVRELRKRIEESAAGPIRVAVLPPAAVQEAGGSAEAAIVQIAGRVRELGVYAVVVPGTGRDAFRAASNGVVPGEEARVAATKAFQANGDAVGPLLIDFVTDVGASDSGDAATAAPASQSSRAGDGGGGVGAGAIILLALGALLFGAVLFAGRERRRMQDRSFGEAKDNARDDLIALGEDVRALDLDVGMPGAPPAAIDDHSRALAAYERAELAWKAARAPTALEPVAMALEEGRWAMACAQARLAGEDPPVRRPPCFFDPGHGPSVRDVEWTPPYGAARAVPACDADAQRIEHGEDPQAKRILTGGTRIPYWEAGAAYGPFASGFFGGAAAGLLPSILVGSMLGMSLGSTTEADEAFGNGGDSGGGNAGGGFGGGDFGGGSF